MYSEELMGKIKEEAFLQNPWDYPEILKIDPKWDDVHLKYMNDMEQELKKVLDGIEKCFKHGFSEHVYGFPIDRDVHDITVGIIKNNLSKCAVIFNGKVEIQILLYIVPSYTHAKFDKVIPHFRVVMFSRNYDIFERKVL